ncbi:MAG: DUF1573 domain-containing protein, partial [Phycisphaerales bacterium]|nr:DUF1573 domain-containing protein [Phycisphaerales bacterium]
IWNGEALVVKRRSSSVKQVDGPRIEWDHCFVDNGVLKPDSNSEYTFAFRNVGNQELTISAVKQSCGCESIALSNERLEPGQTSTLKVTIDPRGKEGYFVNYAVVRANDPQMPVSVMKMAGGVPTMRVLSTQAMSLPDLVQGGKVTGEFYVSDPGFGGLKIREVHVMPTTESERAKHLTGSATVELVGEQVARIGRASAYRAKPEDYVVQLSVEADEQCSLGIIHGKVILVAEANGEVSTHELTFQSFVVQDIHAVPGIALITLGDDGTGSAMIKLKSHSHRDLRVIDISMDSDISVEVRQTDASTASDSRFTLSASMPAVVPGAAPIEANALFKMHNGTVVRVPTVIFKPPQ